MLTPRFDLRKTELEKIFSKDIIVKIWRTIVRGQLRNADINDLFDHYDFNYNIEQRALAIRNEILDGTYKVSQPLIYKLEKKFGVCRHVIVPQPVDALVLQVLTESIADNILKAQPSAKAFYSRDKHNVPMPHELQEYGLSWIQQWKSLQRQIYQFTETKKLIIVTDLSNFYDSIYLDELRKVFTSYSQIPEVVIDLLFKIVEDIGWRPDYLPSSKRGLPTTNIEGVRLLAHSFIFEIDDFLKKSTNDSFTRWMDDFVIGSNEKKEAIGIISSVSDMLKSRGLALNLSKTDIYDAKQAYFHFQILENRDLDSYSKIKNTHPNYEETIELVYEKFQTHFIDKSPRYWEKITKRYITFFAKNKSQKIIDSVASLYTSYPNLRTNFIYYLNEIGYSADAAEIVLMILNQLDIFDDISLYSIVILLADWNIPVNKEAADFLKKVESRLSSLSFSRNNSSDFIYILWFKTKYNHAEDLLKFILKYQNLWQGNSYLRRQATAALARVYIYDRDAVQKLLSLQISSGVISTISIAGQIAQFSKLKTLDQKLTSYLFLANKNFPLQKFLVLCSILNSEKIRQNEDVRKKVMNSIKDSYYIRWLSEQYNIPFERT